MATVSRTGQLAQTGVTGAGEWDSRLNRLLEDLQETVIPTDSRSRNAQEYREYRLTQRTQVNDEAPQTVDEKWVEIGNLVGGGPVTSGSITDSAYGTTSPSRFTESKSVAFADEQHTSTRLPQRTPNIEYLAPANLTTELRSGPSSPTGYSSSIVPSGSSRSPKVERKEFYSKASYTTMIKGTGGDAVDLPNFSTDRIISSDHSSSSHRLLDDFSTTDAFPSRPIGGMESMSSSSETRKTYMTSSETRRNDGLSNGIGAPLYTSTPMKPVTSSLRDTSSYSRDVITNREVTPPPQKADPLKTPPMIRKILQSSQKDLSSHHHHHTSTTSSSTTREMTSSSMSSSKPPPVGGVPLPILQSSPVSKPAPIPSYDEPPERIGARYYTSTVTTEHRERDVSPIRRFPSPQPPKQGGEPPKRLDELLASFEDSTYTRSTTYGGSDGPHKSVPYGPGTHPVRSVRIDDNVTNIRDEETSELIQRKNVTQYQNPAYDRNKPHEPLIEHSRNVQGPPVFYPPGQMFTRTEEDNMKQEAVEGKGKAKMKMERKHKENEKMKSKHKEKGGEGAVPVPVCLPVCCAAPCTIM